MPKQDRRDRKPQQGTETIARERAEAAHPNGQRGTLRPIPKSDLLDGEGEERPDLVAALDLADRRCEVVRATLTGGLVVSPVKGGVFVVGKPVKAYLHGEYFQVSIRASQFVSDGE